MTVIGASSSRPGAAVADPAVLDLHLQERPARSFDDEVEDVMATDRFEHRQALAQESEPDRRLSQIANARVSMW